MSKMFSNIHKVKRGNVACQLEKWFVLSGVSEAGWRYGEEQATVATMSEHNLPLLFFAV